MKIKKVRVDWMDGWSNNPRFEVFMEGELNQPLNGNPKTKDPYLVTEFTI